MLKKSFWTIMFIHIAAFTAIGLFTARGWRLLVIFLAGLILWQGLHGLLYKFAARCPQYKLLNRYASSMWIFARNNKRNKSN